jgi:hypothetical protein
MGKASSRRAHRQLERRVAAEAAVRKRKRQILALALAASAACDARMPRFSSPDKQPRRFGPRLDWEAYLRGFSAQEFKETYRVSRELFDSLLSSVRDELTTVNTDQAERSSSGPVLPEIRLSMTLRWLAGGSFLDIMRLHKVSKTEFYQSLWRTIDAINNNPDFKIAFPFDIDSLVNIEAGFRAKVRAVTVFSLAQRTRAAFAF